MDDAEEPLVTESIFLDVRGGGRNLYLFTGQEVDKDHVLAQDKNALNCRALLSGVQSDVVLVSTCCAASLDVVSSQESRELAACVIKGYARRLLCNIEDGHYFSTKRTAALHLQSAVRAKLGGIKSKKPLVFPFCAKRIL